MPTIRHDLTGKIREIENVFIPLGDGCRLAARLWAPAEGGRVPAILEYLPYRKRDFMRHRDERIHRYFAAHGYASIRVDVRGSGDSDGLLDDEYTAQELADAVEVIAWIAQQDWCDGAVGMMGISWGGFNSLQVAALQPPALKAVITLCSTDDRYADDAHWMGGCLLNENLQWGAILMTYNALPPDPQIVGDGWRRMWLERIDRANAFPAIWMSHARRDAYWKHGSVCEDFSAVAVPVYAVGGWADGYSNSVGRLLAGLSCPRKGLMGPWAHTFPQTGIPGPSIGFLQEALRWWDHWLAGKDTGIMDEPMYRVWLQESVRPQPQYRERPGRWVAETEWPSSRIVNRRWHMNPGHLEEAPSTEVALSFASPQLTGMVGGEWCAFGADGEMPLDQRPDDGRSLVFDTDPLEERLEILGAPVIELDLSVNRPIALVAARLNDVAPDGASTRVSYGLLNLTHRNSHEHPEPMVPGETCRVRVQLNDVGHAFPPGHRIRLALSTAYWPIAWPPPEEVNLTLWSARSVMTLPVRPPGDLDETLAPFPPAEVAPGTEHTPLNPIPFRRVVERDLTTNELIYTLSSDGGEFGGYSLARVEEIDMELGYTLLKRHRIQANDPLSASSELVQKALMRRGAWAIRVETEVKLTSALDHLHFSAELVAYESDEEIRRRRWDLRIPRDHF